MQPNGQLRDMVCRSLMLALHRDGQIQLPAKRQSPLNNAIAHRRIAAVADPQQVLLLSAPFDTTGKRPRTERTEVSW